MSELSEHALSSPSEAGLGRRRACRTGAGYNNLARAANEEEKQVDVSSREGRNEEAVTEDDDDDGDTNAGHGRGETRV